MRTTGTDLKIERVRANVTIIALAAQMGLSRQSIWVLERSAEVDQSRAAEYRAALSALRDVGLTSERATA